MKKILIKGIKLLCVIAIFLLMGIIVIPFVLPIKVKGIIHPYEYTVFGSYVEITRYTGEEEHVVIPETLCFRQVKEIGITNEHEWKELKAFELNEFIRSVYIPDSVERIGRDCFSECRNLERVRLSLNLKELSSSMFALCGSLIEIEIPEGVVTIETNVFSKCKSLEKVQLPETVKSIEKGAFIHCINLEEVVIPSGVEKIGWNAFENTKFETSWTDEFVILGDNVLVKYNGDDEIVRVPEGVTFISLRMFDGCEEMTQLILPSSVKTCEEIAYGCENLKYVVIQNPEMEFPWNEEFIRKSPNVILIGSKGSTTEAYAKEYGYKFLESITE